MQEEDPLAGVVIKFVRKTTSVGENGSNAVVSSIQLEPGWVKGEEEDGVERDDEEGTFDCAADPDDGVRQTTDADADLEEEDGAERDDEEGTFDCAADPDDGVRQTADADADLLVGKRIEAVRRSVSLDKGSRETVVVSVYVGWGWDWYHRVTEAAEGSGEKKDGGKDAAMLPTPGSAIDEVTRYTAVDEDGREVGVVSILVDGKSYELVLRLPPPPLPEFEQLPSEEIRGDTKFVYMLDDDFTIIWELQFQKRYKVGESGQKVWKRVEEPKRHGVLVFRTSWLGEELV